MIQYKENASRISIFNFQRYLQLSSKGSLSCGMIVTQNDIVWVALIGSLKILTISFEEIRTLEEDLKVSFNNFNLPKKNISLIKINKDETAVYWFKDNLEIIEVDAVLFQKKRTILIPINVPEIESLVGFALKSDSSSLMLFTQRRMLKERIYIIFLKDSRKPKKWDFYNSSSNY